MSLIHVTSENFEKALQAAPGVAVVDFFATWCGPCKMLAPVIEEAAEDMPEIQFYKVDVDEAPELARSFKVMSVPTLAFFKNGELVKKNVGAVSYEELEELKVGGLRPLIRQEILEMQEKNVSAQNRYVFSCIFFCSFLSWKKRLLPQLTKERSSSERSFIYVIFSGILFSGALSILSKAYRR